MNLFFLFFGREQRSETFCVSERPSACGFTCGFTGSRWNLFDDLLKGRFSRGRCDLLRYLAWEGKPEEEEEGMAGCQINSSQVSDHVHSLLPQNTVYLELGNLHFSTFDVLAYWDYSRNYSPSCLPQLLFVSTNSPQEFKTYNDENICGTRDRDGIRSLNIIEEANMQIGWEFHCLFWNKA